MVLSPQLTKADDSKTYASRRLKMYVESSVQAAYMLVLDGLNLKSNLERVHPLALLTNALKYIAETELIVFCPVSHKWCPEAGMISDLNLFHSSNNVLPVNLEIPWIVDTMFIASSLRQYKRDNK